MSDIKSTQQVLLPSQILIVDDDLQLLKISAAMLKSPDYSVLTCSIPEDVLNTVLTNSI